MKKKFEIKINLYLLQKIFLIRVKSFLNKRFYFVDEYEQVLELGRIMLKKKFWDLKVIIWVQSD